MEAVFRLEHLYRWLDHCARNPGVSGHEWIHKQLGLGPDEQKALERIETKFAQRKQNLMDEIRNANKELAEAISKTGQILREFPRPSKGFIMLKGSFKRRR
jgi:hypothetical protein